MVGPVPVVVLKHDELVFLIHYGSCYPGVMFTNPQGPQRGINRSVNLNTVLPERRHGPLRLTFHYCVQVTAKEKHPLQSRSLDFHKQQQPF